MSEHVVDLVSDTAEVTVRTSALGVELSTHNVATNCWCVVSLSFDDALNLGTLIAGLASETHREVLS